MSLNEREALNKLVKLVCDWWKENQYEVYNDGEDDFNVYDGEPDFVIFAKKIQEAGS